MLRPEILRKRLDKLDTYLEFLDRAQEYEKKAFMETPEYYGSVERFLHLSIETLNDMANHVIAAKELGFIDQYSDIPEHFANEQWIDEEMQEIWTKMIGFRNILVHDYLEVDREMVYEILQNNLDDLKKLKKVFVRFL